MNSASCDRINIKNDDLKRTKQASDALHSEAKRGPVSEPEAVIHRQQQSLEDYDRSLGTDELNLCEFPLASLSTRTEPGQTTLEFEDSVFDSSAKTTVHRTLLVTGSEHFGLPTAIDNDVLLMLIHLTNVRSRFQDRRVEFTRYELLKFLGWPRDGKSHRRLSESLMRWMTVTLHYRHAWWNRSGRRWANRSFHVIGSLELRGRDDFRDDGRSSFTWDDVIFQSFQSGNLKRIDLNVYFSLKLAVSKQMYRFLDKRFWHKSQLEFDLRQFATEHIGLSRRYDAHEIKRKLTPAIQELQAIGFLADSPVKATFRRTTPGKWQIVLRKSSKGPEKTPPQSRWESELTSRSISRKTARKLAEEFSPEHIAEKIEIHDTLVGNQDQRIRRNSAGFLVAAIRDNYRTPNSNRKTSPPKIRATPQVNAQPPTFKPTDSDKKEILQQEEAIQFDSFWKGLSGTEQEEFELQAVAASSKFHRNTISRLESTDRLLWNQLRTQLIMKHWSSTFDR